MNISKKGQKRYDSIIEAAQELFLQNGYENTSLNQIVTKSGGSLASVYKFFENKEKLFMAILKIKMDEFKCELDALTVLKESNDLSEFLNAFGLVYFEIFYKPESTKFFRIVIAETYKSKDLAQLTAQLMTDVIIKTIADFLRKPNIAPLLKCGDAEAVAFSFCSLIREPFFFRTLILGEEPKPKTKEEKMQIVAGIVDSFLNGICK
ncbi:TetR/AcrR family transcriptional regulator [Campylobacter sp. RM9344]|uniref:TetR/AcrR family transcriptional regulator n=1 Tax=Campylobacter californiensis TaxID=1032243 RepID=A0AAW3ZUK1_9BACT|nr:MULTISPECIES: TetR/AcrR family transcriptional regulator [unclassified Campylobacter]MBE2984597.1 TetR/AcrR family transcriptional regulator [Campylobacter sp. RM6883]MBE2986789.1 TetR/AcrR family transcriptional regulator [Campylobacter sp. RM12919]MBE2988533.1 TetR/AcrR family transcriptional regulator [Campylobacter sp. RM12920]MBE2995115.1 TetR/AcrR family transcriptional regulator [Campylobacter sp. RM6913]MBE3021654.1 TetR/AcrR family transcriptional regulator [Campylobacter sp. 7477a